jgi:tRNA (cytosine34-C5)-methyltransferase
MRILPHHQDTGGFFVAVLCKIKPLPWQAKSLPTFSNTVNAEEILPLEKKPIHILGKPAFIRKKRSGFKEDPFVFLDHADPMIQQIK